MTKNFELNNSEIIRAARKILTDRGPEFDHSSHSLLDTWRSAKARRDIGVAFLDKYGEQLKELDNTAYIQLEGWRDLAI